MRMKSAGSVVSIINVNFNIFLMMMFSARLLLQRVPASHADAGRDQRAGRAGGAARHAARTRGMLEKVARVSLFICVVCRLVINIEQRGVGCTRVPQWLAMSIDSQRCNLVHREKRKNDKRRFVRLLSATARPIIIPVTLFFVYSTI